MSSYLKIYSNCIPCRGIKRSALYDLQRNRIFTVPHTLVGLIDENGCLPAATDDEDNKEVFTEYIDFFLSNEIAFPCSEKQIALFPPLSLEWNFPAVISNCILDMTDKFPFFNDNLLLQLDSLNCHHLYLRFFENVNWSLLSEQLKLIRESSLKSVELLIPNERQSGFLDRIEQLVAANRKIKQVIIHGAESNGLVKQADDLSGSIILSDCIIDDSIHCGVIDPEQFVVNIPHYTESLYHNTCLNRKIAIDTEGNIKNCPGMKESFGNIKNTKLQEAIHKHGFKKYWNIKKEEITKCKDCEFRHACTDCRAYLEDPEDMYSAPLKCGYDPYTCQWEEWSTNPLKQMAIDYYGMKGLPSE